MKVIFYSTKEYEKPFFESANNSSLHFTFTHQQLQSQSVHLAKGHDAICCFVTDILDKSILTTLHQQHIKLILLRSAGFDHIDLISAKELGLSVFNVPSYSPHAIAEFSVGLILALSRKIALAHRRIQSYNFALDGLLGFNINKKTIGVIGTGNIGSIFAKIISGFDCKILAYDLIPNEFCKELGVQYTSLTDVFKLSDIISLHCPLNQETRHIVNKDTLALMKRGVMLINTGRGALIDTKAVIDYLKNGIIGYLGMDVYENEHNLFFQDHSNEIIQDDYFSRLQSFPNVIITGHQAFFTEEALTNIAKTTLQNIINFKAGKLEGCLTNTH